MCSCSKQVNQQNLGVGNNLAMLFGSPVEDTVLLVGSKLLNWYEMFPNVVHWDHVLEVEESADQTSFGLVLYHSDCVTTRSHLIKDLKILRSMIRQGGTLVVFARNLYSLPNVKRFIRNARNVFASQPRLGFAGYKKALQESGFCDSRGYLTLPNLETPEEIVSIDSSLLEVPCNCHVLLRLAHRYTFFKYIADGYLFIDSCNPIEQVLLLREVASKLQVVCHMHEVSCSLERFDIRMRGAMVLFLFENISKKHFVVRVVSDSDTQIIVRRNEQFIRWLLAHQSLSENVKHHLPDPISSFEFAGSAVFIETLVNGVLAWKVNVPAQREIIFKGASEFIFQLQQGTRRETFIDHNVFQELFSPVQDRLESCVGVTESFFLEVLDVVSRIKKKLLGKSCTLTATHGDYGYGNILVEPRTGKLVGVIDWDTGRHLDFTGIDFYNLLVQCGRTEKNYGVFQAFSVAVTDITLRDSLDTTERYGHEFAISGDSLNILLYTGFLRYVSRSAQYPTVYNTEQDEYIKILQWLKNNIPL